MGSITHLNDRLRTVPQQIAADDQVVAAAAEVAADTGDLATILEHVARAGLLAISVPSEFGGADLPNDVITRAVSIISAAHRDVGVLLASHFAVLEFVRSSGTEEQRRGVYGRAALGELFRLVPPDATSHAHELACRSDGIGCRLVGPAVLQAPDGDPVWVAFSATRDTGEPVLVLVAQSQLQAADAVRSLEEPEDGVHVPADHVLSAGSHAARLAASLATLLDAAVLVGELERSVGAGTPQADPEDAGRRFMDLQVLQALILRVASALDAVQVGSEAGEHGVWSLAGTLQVLVSRLRGGSAADEKQLLARLGADLANSNVPE